MEIIDTKYPGYTLAIDYHPYVQTRQILTDTSYWWEHKTRAKNPSKVSNYLLDADMINSLEYSLQHRMKDGLFNFIYYDGDLIFYSGFRIDWQNKAWVHRGAGHPVLGKNHVGALSAIILPYQARIAKDRGCESYNMSFNESNYKLYSWYKDKHYYNGKVNLRGGEKFMDEFDYHENVFVMGQNQFVATLDLTKPNIEEILL